MSEQINEEFEPKFSAETLKELMATEQSLADYAAIALKESTVEVAIDDCRHPFIFLHRDLKKSLDHLPQQPTTIDAVDLQLRYDPEGLKFTTLRAGLKLDNNYSLIFQRIKSPLPGQKTDLYYAALLNPVGGIAQKTSVTELFGEAAVAEVLDGVGVALPKAPQEASWSSIKEILDFASVWRATTTHTTPLDIARTVQITDHVEGVRDKNAEDEDISSVRLRELVLSLDEADDIFKPASTCWRVKARKSFHEGERRQKPPRIYAIERIPLQFETRDEIFENFFDMEFVTENRVTVRKELTEQSVSLDLNPPHLQAIRATIAEASTGHKPA